MFSWGAAMFTADFNSLGLSAVRYFRTIGWRRSAASLALLGGLTLTACAPAPLMFGNFDTGDSSAKSGPTVQQIVLHVNCELERAVNATDKMSGKPDYLLAKLRQYQYVAQSTLTLDVTDVEGFSPSLTLGPPSAHATAVNLGGQLTGTQHRTLSIILQADLAKLSHNDPDVVLAFVPDFVTKFRKEDQKQRVAYVDGLKKSFDAEHHGQELPIYLRMLDVDAQMPTSEQGQASDWRASQCPIITFINSFGNKASPGDNYQERTRLSFDESSIKGDLDLAESIKDGIVAIDANGPYGVLSSPPPKILPGPECDVRPTLTDETREICDSKPSAAFRFGDPYPQRLCANYKKLTKDEKKLCDSKTLNLLYGQYFSGAGAPTTDPTTFTSTVDFSVVEGISGGPTWDLQHFKGPSSGSSGPLSLNRTAKDTMLIAFTARCDSDRSKEVSIDDPRTYFETLDGCKVEVKPKTVTTLSTLYSQFGLGLQFQRILETSSRGQPTSAQTQNAVSAVQNATTSSVLQSLSPNFH
jgi:hypothetical protein